MTYEVYVYYIVGIVPQDATTYVENIDVPANLAVDFSWKFDEDCASHYLLRSLCSVA